MGPGPVRVVAVVSVFLVLILSVWLIFGRKPTLSTDMTSIRAAIEARRYDQAEAMLVRRLGVRPDDDQGWLMLGSLQVISGRDGAALTSYERVCGPGPVWSQARTQVGEIMIRRRDAAGAERAFREVADRDPKSTDVRRRLAYLLTLEARPEEARAVLRELYRLSPDRRHLVTLVSLASPDHEGRDEANEMEAYLRVTPDDPILRRARGLILLRSGKPAEARPHLEAAVPEIEDDPIGRIALAECRLATGDLAGVEPALGAEPARGADRASWWLVKGQVEEARGRADAAIAAYRNGREANADDRKVLYRLGQALARKGEVAEGRPLLDRAEAIRLRWLTLVLEADRCARGGEDAGLFEHIAELCRESGLTFEA